MTTTKIRTVFHPPSTAGRQALNELAVELITHNMARVTDPAIDGGNHIANLVTDYHCSICHRNNDSDGSGSCRHKDALYTIEAANVSQAEAERLRRPVVEPWDELVY